VIRDISGSTGHGIGQEYNIVYEYLRQRAAIQSSRELIQEFQNLLQQGKNTDHKISAVLDKIICDSKPGFDIFLSNCFYLILDCWLETPESMLDVDQLFNILDILVKTRSYDRRRKQLVQLIKNYQQSTSYLQLKAFIAIIHPQAISSDDDHDGHDGQNPFSTNEVSGSQSNHRQILSERAFRVALKQYVGKIDHEHTVLERAQRFIAKNELRNSYGDFKQDLYHFIASDIKPRNNTYNFKSRFKQKLDDIFIQSNAKSLNRTLILQTCRQLLSFLIVDPAISNNPQRFAELIANLGTAQVMMILVKITLICPESKSDLEKKICTIVSHYQLHNVQENLWLIKSLEHLLMAFSIYFGNLDVSLARSAVSKQ